MTTAVMDPLSDGEGNVEGILHSLPSTTEGGMMGNDEMERKAQQPV
jgi:hypothetical protein